MLSCAIIELLQNEMNNGEPRSLRLLSQLQVCCSKSNEVLAYIESIGGLNLDVYMHMKECRTIIEAINKLVASRIN
jgi:hypothetical protein